MYFSEVLTPILKKKKTSRERKGSEKLKGICCCPYNLGGCCTHTGVRSWASHSVSWCPSISRDTGLARKAGGAEKREEEEEEYVLKGTVRV